MISDQNELSVRSPSELMAMEFNESDNFLADGLIAKGQRGVILGPAGIGKSMLGTQLAYSLILQKAFLGLPVRCRDKRCFFLQAENSNFRLKSQFDSQMSNLTDEEKKSIDAHLRIHTLEHPLDSRLRLKAEEANLVARMISKEKADFLFVDPLNACAKGSLNTDDGMLETLHELERLARDANPDAAVIIVHHTRTDNNAHRDVVGPNRSNYGRGSKALHGWSRGTINIAAGDPVDTSKIVVACGKNSNGAEFQPLGAVRNPTTMLFEVDPSFNLERWKASMAGKAEGVTPETVAEFVSDRSLTRAELVAEIIRETGCQKTKAYDAVKLAAETTIVQDSGRRFRAIKVGAK